MNHKRTRWFTSAQGSLVHKVHKRAKGRDIHKFTTGAETSGSEQVFGFSYGARSNPIWGSGIRGKTTK